MKLITFLAHTHNQTTYMDCFLNIEKRENETSSEFFERLRQSLLHTVKDHVQGTIHTITITNIFHLQKTPIVRNREFCVSYVVHRTSGIHFLETLTQGFPATKEDVYELKRLCVEYLQKKEPDDAIHSIVVMNIFPV